MKTLADLTYDELIARAAQATQLPELRHLKGKHNQKDHADGAGSARPKSKKWKLLSAEALDRVRAGRPFDDETAAAVAEVFTLEFGGLSTSDVTVVGRFQVDGSPSVFVKGRIRNAAGAEVGNFSRLLISEGGKTVATHGVFEIDKKLQGQGFAQAFNGQAFDWYRESGVDQVQLVANIDVGGYAWARAGYDWADEEGVAAIQKRLANVVRRGAAKIPTDRREEQQRLAEEMLARLKTGFGSENFPTPFELSQLGRWDGAGRDDWWAGKVVMMGSTWNGVTVP